MCRPPDTLLMPEIRKSAYKIARLHNIEECEAEFLRIYGYPIDLSDKKY